MTAASPKPEARTIVVLGGEGVLLPAPLPRADLRRRYPKPEWKLLLVDGRPRPVRPALIAHLRRLSARENIAVLALVCQGDSAAEVLRRFGAAMPVLEADEDGADRWDAPDTWPKACAVVRLLAESDERTRLIWIDDALRRMIAADISSVSGNGPLRLPLELLGSFALTMLSPDSDEGMTDEHVEIIETIAGRIPARNLR